MKVKLDAAKLSESLRLVKSLPKSTTTPIENIIAIGARMDPQELIVFSSTGGMWTRVAQAEGIVVEDPGVVFVDRSRFLSLIGVLKDQVTIRTVAAAKGAGHLEVKPSKGSGKFTLAVQQTGPSRIEVPPSPNPATLKASDLRDQLNLSLLEGELAFGGYRILGDGKKLTITVTDRQRFVVTTSDSACQVDLSIHIKAARLVLDLLKEAKDSIVDIRTSPNLTSLSFKRGTTAVEIGYNNSVEKLPVIVDQILSALGPNHGRFEALDLLDNMSKLDVLADIEIPFADFDFSDPATCQLQAQSVNGTADIGLDCPNEVQQKDFSILRLQIPHLKSLVSKAKLNGASYVTCRWGQQEDGRSYPVRWTFEFDDDQDQKFENIDMVYITAAMNRAASI